MANEKGASFENLKTAINQIQKDFAQKDEVTAAINAKVASTYKAGGSVAFAALPTPDEAHLGFVYNVTDKFTTTADYVEGEGKKHPAGTNVAIVAVTEGESQTTAYKYDVLAGFVDLSNLAEKDQVATDIGTAKTEAVNEANSATDEKLAEYVKTTDIEFATEAEVLALFGKTPVEESGT